MGIGLQDIKSKIDIVKEEMAQGTPKNIQKRILYEPKTVKSKSGIKSNGGISGDVEVKIDPTGREGFGWEDALGLFFPPANLANIGQLPPGSALPPTYTISGDPAAINQLTGFKQDTGGGGDPFSGALESMGTGLKLAGMAIPLMIGVMLLYQVKGLFK